MQAAVQANRDEVMEILQHVEDQLESGRWNMLGWWKAASTSQEGPGVTAKCHIVALHKVGGIQRYGSHYNTHWCVLHTADWTVHVG